MLEKISDRISPIAFLVMFLACIVIYNIGYFSAIGGAMRYFYFVPASFSDVLKTGLSALFPLVIIFLVFKPILINPAFGGSFPGGSLLLGMAIAVLVSNFLYFSILGDSQNRSVALISEATFYLFALVCFVAIVYYFLSNVSPYLLTIVFSLSVLAMTFLIGIVDAKIGINSSYSDTKSQILLKNDKIINASILRSFDKGVFVIIGSASSVDYIGWDEIKGIKFRKVGGF